jgi:hypothetical protein
MPRTGGGVYTKPFPDVTSGTTIASAVHNGIVADVETDLNAARPIIAGGTGAVTAAAARVNLQVERAMQTVTNFDAHVWEMGSFYAATGATVGPPSGGTTTENFFGIAYGDATNMFVEARSQTTGLKYIRKKTGTWGAWSLDGGDKLSNTGGTISGNLSITGTLGVTGTTTLGTLNAGTTTLGATTFNGNISAAARTLSIGAITSTTINTAGNTITAGTVNAGAITGSSLNISGGSTLTGSIAANAISCSTLNTNGNTLTTGTINSGTINSGAINASSDIRTVRSGGATGVIYLGNGDHYLFFDGTGYQMANGSLSVGGQVTASQFNGSLNGNANSATNAGYASSAGSAPANGGTSSASRSLVTASDGRTWSVYGTGQVLAIDDSSSGLRGAHFTPYNDPNPSAIDLYMPYHTITTNGVNGSWTNNYMVQFVSSARYKTDIRDMPRDVVDKIMAFRPVTFRSKCPIDDPNKLHFGLIAEEVEAIEPLLVQYDYTGDAYENEPDPNGGPIRHRLRKDAKKQVMGLDYNAIVSLMLRKVQEQEERIVELEAKLRQ